MMYLPIEYWEVWSSIFRYLPPIKTAQPDGELVLLGIQRHENRHRVVIVLFGFLARISHNCSENRRMGRQFSE